MDLSLGFSSTTGCGENAVSILFYGTKCLVTWQGTAPLGATMEATTRPVSVRQCGSTQGEVGDRGKQYIVWKRRSETHKVELMARARSASRSVHLLICIGSFPTWVRSGMLPWNGAFQGGLSRIDSSLIASLPIVHYHFSLSHTYSTLESGFGGMYTLFCGA